MRYIAKSKRSYIFKHAAESLRCVTFLLPPDIKGLTTTAKHSRNKAGW